MIAAILGFMPALERLLSIAIKSGTAANVVPRPAIKPNTSDRLNLGIRRLAASRGSMSLKARQPLSTNKVAKRKAIRYLSDLATIESANFL
jgi:hypothetical protein